MNLSFFSYLQAYCFFGQDLLVQEKCGESIRVLQYSKACTYVHRNTSVYIWKHPSFIDFILRLYTYLTTILIFSYMIICYLHFHFPCPVSDRASKLCDQYARTKGAGTIARPERHPFFQKLGPMVKLHLDKSERENGFM